jgi:alpha-tubulin suppressor-like RCC1 family protein
VKFRQIATSGFSSCGVTLSGSVKCWGKKPCFTGASSAACTAPLGSFEEVTVGFHVACAREKSGRVHCWGDNIRGQLNVPEKNFVAIAAGGAFVCGIEEDGAVDCWGTRGKMTSPPQDLRLRTGR